MRRSDEETAGAAVALLLRIVTQRLEPWQLVDGHVDLHHRAVHLDGFDCLTVVGRKIAIIDQLEIGPFGIGIGEDDVGLDLLPAGQGDAGGASVLDDDLLDIGAESGYRRRASRRCGSAPG